jgi:5'-nucleotidase
MAVGNHEFDVGLDGLLEACRFANFELLSANYDFSRTVLRDLVKPYIVRRVGPVRVGIFGVSVMLKGLVAGSLCRDVGYSNPIPAARLATEHLRTVAKCDLVICLSHLGNNGYGGEPGEQDVAREVEGIDLVVGGHSHTFMDEPTRVQHVDRETLVFQVGWAGINLGRVDFHMRAGRVTKSLAQSIPVGTAAHAPALRG